MSGDSSSIHELSTWDVDSRGLWDETEDLRSVITPETWSSKDLADLGKVLADAIAFDMEHSHIASPQERGVLQDFSCLDHIGPSFWSNPHKTLNITAESSAPVLGSSNGESNAKSRLIDYRDSTEKTLKSNKRKGKIKSPKKDRQLSDRSPISKPNSESPKKTTLSKIKVSLSTLSSSDCPSSFTCHQAGCDYECAGFDAYEMHTLSSHARYCCPHCSSTFTSRGNCKRHIRYHFTGKQHKCPTCDKYFARAESLKEHRFIHTKSYKSSVCVNCDMKFPKKAALISHLKKCFTSDQLDSDLADDLELNYEATNKTDDSNDLLDPSSDSMEYTTSTSNQSPEAIIVSRHEYLKKEKDKILEIKNYLEDLMEDTVDTRESGTQDNKCDVMLNAHANPYPSDHLDKDEVLNDMLEISVQADSGCNDIDRTSEPSHFSGLHNITLDLLPGVAPFSPSSDSDVSYKNDFSDLTSEMKAAYEIP